MNKNYEEIEEELENKDLEEDEIENDYTCADCIYSDCDGNQLCDMFEPW